MTNEELVIRIKAGVDVGNNMLQLWQQVKDFVHSIANRYTGYTAIEDLMQEGYLSLYDAIDGYDPAAGFLFLTYAKSWIRMRMSRYVYRDRAIRIPEQKLQQIRKYRKAVQRFQMQYGREPSETEFCYMLQMTREDLREVLSWQELSTVSSLDVPVSDRKGGKESNLEEVISSGEDIEKDVLDSIEQQKLSETLWSMVDDLQDQHSEVLRMRYRDERTLKEIGDIIGCDTDRARQIESKGLRELRLPHNKHRLKVFLPETVERQAYYGGGLGAFNRTWTSSTERVAMRLY